MKNQRRPGLLPQGKPSEKSLGPAGVCNRVSSAASIAEKSDNGYTRHQYPFCREESGSVFRSCSVDRWQGHLLAEFAVGTFAKEGCVFTEPPCSISHDVAGYFTKSEKERWKGYLQGSLPSGKHGF